MGNKQFFKLLMMTSIVVVLCISACRERSFNMSPDAQLAFSVDTLRFDTVFTELGSATRSFKIFNEDEQSILIENIYLANEPGGEQFFRMNVDGIASNSLQDVEILPNDSLWVFVEVTIDPDNPLSISPFIIEDQVLIEVNGNEQVVYLEAWGQNANYFPSRFNAGVDSILLCDLGSITFDDPKPYVIYGRILIENCELILPPGTDVYVHGGVVSNDSMIYNDGLLLFGENGKLSALGELSNPVVIQGDRLESGFQDVKGQWTGLWFLSNSDGGVLEHTTIKNSLVGFRVDSMANITMNSCVIQNTSGAGIISLAGNIQASNSLIHSNNGNALQLTYGGNYLFDYCTIASYGNQSESLRLNNYLCIDPLCLQPVRINPLSAVFRNCIFSGSSSDELFLEDASDNDPTSFNYIMENCIVKVDELLTPEQFPDFFENCEDCYNLQTDDALFLNLDENDFHLDTLSVAETKAKVLVAIPEDLDGNSRDSNTPDIGCYEYQY